MQVSWGVLKNFVTPKQISIQYLDLVDAYELRAYDGVFELACNLPKDGGAEQTDFETNFKAKGNYKLDQRDSDGAPLARMKAAPTGWSYQLRGLEITTGKVGGDLVNRDHNKTPLTDVTVYCYDATGALVTDPSNNSVPDYPPAYGGTKIFIQDINFKYLQNEKVNADGRAAKALLYNNPAPHTNKMRFIFHHGAGVQMVCSVWLELYKL